MDIQRQSIARLEAMPTIMRTEFCTLCKTRREVKMTRCSKVITAPDGNRNVIRTDLYHCELLVSSPNDFSEGLMDKRERPRFDERKVL